MKLSFKKFHLKINGTYNDQYLSNQYFKRDFGPNISITENNYVNAFLHEVLKTMEI